MSHLFADKEEEVGLVESLVQLNWLGSSNSPAAEVDKYFCDFCLKANKEVMFARMDSLQKHARNQHNILPGDEDYPRLRSMASLAVEAVLGEEEEVEMEEDGEFEEEQELEPVALMAEAEEAEEEEGMEEVAQPEEKEREEVAQPEEEGEMEQVGQLPEGRIAVVRVRKLKGSEIQSLSSPAAKSPRKMKEDLASTFLEEDMQPTEAGVKFLAKKSPEFNRLWSAYTTNITSKDALHNIRRIKRVIGHRFSANLKWSGMPTSTIAEEGGLLAFFEDPASTTKQDVHILYNKEKAFRSQFQQWCNGQGVEDEAKLWRRFRSTVLGVKMDHRRQ